MEFSWDDFRQDCLKILKFDGYSLDWAEFVIKNRKNKSRTSIHNYDIVIGPIADDTIGYQIRRYEDGILSLAQFMDEIKFHTVTIQYLFATEKAIATLERL